MTLGSRSSVTEDAEFWEVSHLAARLNQYACEVGARYVQDDFLRSQFTQEVAYAGRAIVEDVRVGNIAAYEGRAKLEQEYRELLAQVWEYLKLVAGVAAGVLQIGTGVAVCKASLGLGCLAGGVPLILHGANNVYENGLNIINRRKDTVGPVRHVYQGVAVVVGGTKSHGNVAYGVSDLGLSAYNLNRLVVKTGAWRLFRYIKADKVNAARQMSPQAIMFEVGVDMLTGDQVIVELEKE